MGIIFNRPMIGVVMCRNSIKGHPSQTLQEKYINAVLNAGGLPVPLPHIVAESVLLDQLLAELDGIMLPGSPSNVQPHLYGENGDEPAADPGRDTLSIALIERALERRIPLFAICRGLQELVVATGGRCIVGCLTSRNCWNTAKILNCRWTSSTRPLTRCR